MAFATLEEVLPQDSPALHGILSGFVTDDLMDGLGVDGRDELEARALEEARALGLPGAPMVEGLNHLRTPVW